MDQLELSLLPSAVRPVPRTWKTRLVDLSSLIRTRGRAEKSVSASFVRELEPGDLAALTVEKGSKTPTIAKVRDSHHTLARLMAQGMSGEEISAITGYSASRISILRNDPAIEDLVQFYRTRITDQFADFATRAAALRDDAIQELHEKVLEEDLPPAQLIEIVKLTADRTGFGPASKSTNVNVNIGVAERLEAARKRVVASGSRDPVDLLSSGSPFPANFTLIEGKADEL